MGGVADDEKEAALDELPHGPDLSVVLHGVEAGADLVDAEDHEGDEEPSGDLLGRVGFLVIFSPELRLARHCLLCLAQDFAKAFIAKVLSRFQKMPPCGASLGWILMCLAMSQISAPRQAT